MKKSASMINTFKLLLVITISSIVVSSCKEQKEDYPALAPLSDYMPLTVGKYFIYRLDSTVISENAKQLLVRSYQVKDSIDAIVTDGSGRQTYRIRRFITDTLASGPWVDNATFYATPVTDPNLGESIEFVDNNMRFIRLKAPIREGFTWPGTSYINTTQSDVQYLNDWQFSYQDVGLPLTIGSQNFPDAITVIQNPDEGGTENLSDPNVKFDERNYSIEQYGKGVGLVYKEFIHWVFQRDVTNSDRYYFTENSYGVKLTLLSHN